MSLHQHHLEGLFKTQIAGPTPRVSELVLGQDPRDCIPNKLSGNAVSAGPGRTLRTTVVDKNLKVIRNHI